jgi:hypothetical protein
MKCAPTGMTPEEIRKVLNQINKHENELREIRRDIHALATIEIYHSTGVVPPPQASRTANSAEVNDYNLAMQRLNDRYRRDRAN